LKEYLSHGMGVNSTALMLLLLDEGREFETVFVDHGGDYPETYDYADYLVEQGYEITTLKPSVSWKGKWDNIYDYFYFHKSIPLIRYRICTDKFKIQTFNKFVETPCVIYLGYDWGETKRAYKPKYKRRKKGIEYQYPLIDERINRSTCINIIQDHNLKVPPKSGCWFCPFQKLSDWKRLRDNYPDLFKKAMDLEERALNHRGKVGLLCNGRRTLSGLYQEDKLTDFPGFATPIAESTNNRNTLELEEEAA